MTNTALKTIPTLAQALAAIPPGDSKDVWADEANVMAQYAQMTNQHGEPLYPEAVAFTESLKETEADYNKNPAELTDMLADNDNDASMHPWWTDPSA